MVKPAEGTPAGTAHVLCDRDGTGETVFYWTGSGWSTNPTSPYYSKPVSMRVLGWKYSRPGTLEPAVTQSAEEGCNK